MRYENILSFFWMMMVFYMYMWTHETLRNTFDL